MAESAHKDNRKEGTGKKKAAADGNASDVSLEEIKGPG